MKNKYKKIIVSVFVICICVMYDYSIVFAVSPFDSVIGNFTGDIKEKQGADFVRDVIKIVLTITRVVAAGLAIIIITYMGTKYMAAAASEKAEIKNKLINYVIGIVLVAGATKIIEIAVTTFSSADLS